MSTQTKVVSRLGKIVFVAIMFLLFIWESMLAYSVFEFGELFEDLNSSSNATIFIAWTQPFIWLLMILTIIACVDLARRSELLVVNSFALVSIIAVSNVFLQILVLYSAYAPIFELGSTVAK